MTKILLSLTGDQVSVKLKSSDRDAFAFLIEALKDRIPAYDRTYSPASREWFIDASARDRAVRSEEHLRGGRLD